MRFRAKANSQWIYFCLRWIPFERIDDQTAHRFPYSYLVTTTSASRRIRESGVEIKRSHSSLLWVLAQPYLFPGWLDTNLPGQRRNDLLLTNQPLYLVLAGIVRHWKSISLLDRGLVHIDSLEVGSDRATNLFMLWPRHELLKKKNLISTHMFSRSRSSWSIWNESTKKHVSPSMHLR